MSETPEALIILSVILVSAVFLVPFVGLFFKKYRGWSAALLATLFMIGAVLEGQEEKKLNDEAQNAGFLDHKDFLAAQEAGVSSSLKWKEIRSKREQAERDKAEQERIELERKAEQERIEREREAEQERLAKECGDRNSIEAFFMSQAPVKKLLKAPSTAEFPYFWEATVSPVGDCQYVINAFVDAQNSFGAMIRTNYRAVMKRNPDNDSWSLIDLDM